MPARGSKRPVELAHRPDDRDIVEQDAGGRRAVHAALDQRREALLASRHPAIRLGARRVLRQRRRDRRVEMALIPELRAERLLLVEVYVVEALDLARHVADILNQRAVRARDVHDAGAALRLGAFGLGRVDLRLGALQRVAVDIDDLAVDGGVYR